MQETWVRFWVRKMPWREEWLPTPVLLSGESHGQKSLLGAHEVTKTEQLAHLITHCFFPGGSVVKNSPAGQETWV